MDKKEKNLKITENVKNTEKPNNSKTIIIILSSVIAVCVVVIIVLLCLLLKKPEDHTSETANSSAQSETTASLEATDSNSQSDTVPSTENTTLTIGTPDDGREAVEIVTKYGALPYPKEWENNLRTEIVESDVYKVEFYGTIEGKEEYQLFDLIFNGTDGYNLGTLKTESGEVVSINIVSYNFEFDDAWSDDQKFVLRSMQEDVNYIIGMLTEDGNFTIPE